MIHQKYCKPKKKYIEKGKEIQHRQVLPEYVKGVTTYSSSHVFVTMNKTSSVLGSSEVCATANFGKLYMQFWLLGWWTPLETFDPLADVSVLLFLILKYQSYCQFQYAVHVIQGVSQSHQ